MSGNRTRYRFSPEVVTRETDEGLVIVNLETGGAWTLNDVGADVCRRFDGKTDIDAIRTALAGIYDVDPDLLARDIDTLLDELQSVGVIEPAE
jgi:hypothetical protein